MKRRIINIDQNKCNGCGACAEACHEGAIGMVNGKAALLRDDYCDGLGDCLPECPVNAITFEEREAAPYDASAVIKNKKQNAQGVSSQLGQWPVQIKLIPVSAPYFEGADLLIAADCTAYTYASFHADFMKGKVTAVGCPKLDGIDYSEKLTEIIARNDIRSITVARMEVPCCGGLEFAARKALLNSGKDIPLNCVTITTDGEIQ